jgi:PhoPQ-activated pathogenicity-related protein
VLIVVVEENDDYYPSDLPCPKSLRKGPHHQHRLSAHCSTLAGVSMESISRISSLLESGRFLEYLLEVIF